MSNLLQQIKKSKKDSDFNKILGKVENIDEIGKKLKQTETDELALKYEVIGLAEKIEKIMLKHDQKFMIGQVFSILSRYFNEQFDISERSNDLLLSFFSDYPKYTRTIVRNNSPYVLSPVEMASSFDIEEVVKTEGSLPEENKIYRNKIDSAISVLDDIDFSRLTKDQCLAFNEKMGNIIKDKQHDLEHNYRLVDKKGQKKNVTTARKKYDPYEDIAATSSTSANPNNKVTQAFIKIRNQFSEMVTQSMYMDFLSPELENEVAERLETFYKTCRFITDKKHKASIPDWSNISMATEDYNSHYASGNIKFLAPLCAKCKDRDEINDPEGKKKIFRHLQMYHEYQVDRFDKNGKAVRDPYIWRCKRCGGTKRKEEVISVERINESLIYINAQLHDIVNKSDIYRALSIYFEELIKPERLKTAHYTSNKLLSKK